VILCLAANPSIDKLFEIDELHAGEVHRPGQFVQVAGGKGLNAARAAATLGADVQVVAILGGHAGAWLADQLGELGIKVHTVSAEAESRSSLSVADRATKRLTEFYENGRPIDPTAWAEFVQTATTRSKDADWTTVSGSVPEGTPERAYGELEIASALALDTVAPAPAGFDLIKVNVAEAAELTGIDTVGTDGEVAGVRALGAGRAAAAITLGARGAVLATPDGAVLRGTLDERGPYPVGSGDSFLAGLVVARAGGGDWDDALALALGAATANAAVPGAACFERSDAERLAKRADVSRI
jgi:1-phosphofructokinase family hexose kinase